MLMYRPIWTKIGLSDATEHKENGRDQYQGDAQFLNTRGGTQVGARRTGSKESGRHAREKVAGPTIGFSRM